MSWWKVLPVPGTPGAAAPSPVQPSPVAVDSPSSSGPTSEESEAVKRISLDSASRDELAAFVKQQASHIKKLETKCLTLIDHYKMVQAERKELLERFNAVSQQAEEAQERLATLPDLQQLCRTLEEKARKLEEDRNAAALDGAAKQKLLAQMDEELKRLTALEKERSGAGHPEVQRLTQELEGLRRRGDDVVAELTARRAVDVAAAAQLTEELREQTRACEALRRENESQAVLAAAAETQRRELAGRCAGLADELAAQRQVCDSLKVEVASRAAASAAAAASSSPGSDDGAIERLSAELEAQRRLAEGLRGDVSSLSARSSAAVAEGEALRGEVAKLSAAKDGLHAELALARNAAGSSAEMLAHFKDENRRLVGELAEARDAARAQSAEHAEALRQLQARAAEAQDGARERERSLAQLEEATQNEIVTLRKERATYADLLASRDAKLAELQHQVATLERQRADEAAASTAAREGERQNAQEELAFAEERGKELTAKLARANQEAAAALASRQREEATLRDRAERAETEGRRAGQRAADMAGERDAEKLRANGLEAKVAELTASVERLQQELALKEQAAVAAVAAAPVSAPAAVASSQLLTSSGGGSDEGGTGGGSAPNVAEEEARKLKLLLRMAKQHLHDYREKYNAATAEARQEREQRQQLASEATARQRQLAEAEAALDHSKTDVASLRDALAGVKSKCQLLQTELADAGERYNDLRGKATTLAAGGGGNVEEWTRARIERDEVRQLRQELSDLRQAVLELNDQNLLLVSEQRSLEATKGELAAARREGERMRGELEELARRSADAEGRHDRALLAVRGQLQAELDAKSAELVELEAETGAKFDELTAQLKLHRQRTKKALEQKDLLVMQLKKRLRDGGKDADDGSVSPTPTAKPGATAAAAAAAAAANTAAAAAAAAASSIPAEVPMEVDPAVSLGQQDAREKSAQLADVVRDNARLLKIYQQRISELERGRQGGEANIEYLKNVLVKYFEKPTADNHKRMIPVLRMLLRLSDTEVNQIEAVHSQSRGWFF